MRITAVAVVVLALCAPRAVTAKSAGAQQWQPLVAGNSWSYGVTRDARVDGGAEPGQTVKLTGTGTTEVMGPSKLFRGADPVFEVVTSTEEKGARGQGRSTTQTSHISESRSGIYLHGQTLVGAPGVSTNLETYRPPLHLLLLPEVTGAGWTVGELRQGAMRMAMQGAIAGFENITTPTKQYQRCLKVRYTGTVTGSLSTGAADYPITRGSMEVIDWYAPGVGLVKETTQFRIQYTGAGKAAMTSTQSTTRILTRATVK